MLLFAKKVKSIFLYPPLCHIDSIRLCAEIPATADMVAGYASGRYYRK